MWRMDNTNIRCFRILDEQNKITMKLSQLFLEELKNEAVNTRRILAAVPLDKGDFKPHEKSFSLKRLAVHVAEINGWWKETLLQDELDFSRCKRGRKFQKGFFLGARIGEQIY